MFCYGYIYTKSPQYQPFWGNWGSLYGFLRYKGNIQEIVWYVFEEREDRLLQK